MEDTDQSLRPTEGLPGYLSAVLYRSPAGPSMAGGGGRTAPGYDMGVPPGGVSWIVVEYEPGVAFPTHHTDTLDLDVVLWGQVDLGLDDGAHRLEAGDCVVVTGVDHGWTAGPDGCCLGVMSIGVAPTG